MDGTSPLVSVGIPTYNRPHGLSKTLEDITKQTYRNLEIIISDNCSPGSETTNVVEKFSSGDNRIRYYRQERNVGPLANFSSVLEKATGTYFMWAADDDKWDMNYIKACVSCLEKNPDIIAVTFETQYFDDNYNMYPFFPEGSSFYSFSNNSKDIRIIHMLMNNYGNLFYSLYRREVLFENRKSCFQVIHNTSLNEIPFFIYLASMGNCRVLPEVKFFKSPPSYESYIQAKWESGGDIFHPMLFSEYKPVLLYHILAFRDIVKVMRKMNVSFYLPIPAFLSLAMHFLYLSIGWKPKKTEKK